MTASTALIAAVGGMIAGSFVSVVAHRVPRGLSVAGPRSQCPSCDHVIAAYDNVPVLSWLALRGRCRNCREPISARYPLLELAVGALFAATVVVLHDDPLQLALGLVLVATLAAVTLTDLERRVIPNRILLAAAAIGLAVIAVGDPAALPDRIAWGLAAGGGLLVVALAHPRGMGMGDVKLAAVLGLFLGRAVAPALLVAFAAGALVGVALMARHGSGARKRAIPFGPFLALGGIVGLLAGDAIVDWYLDGFAGD
jgi:leader peptidase (prepilin peptidase)/N-methyltransferase